jgi:hypothetical protein
VSSGTHTVFVGAYTSTKFHVISGAGGTIEITDPTVVNGGSVQPARPQPFPRLGIDLPDIAFGVHDRVWQLAVLPSAEAYCAETPTEYRDHASLFRSSNIEDVQHGAIGCRFA